MFGAATLGERPGDRYGWHEHDYRKVVFCVEGSITFHTDDGDWSCGGDRLDLTRGRDTPPRSDRPARVRRGDGAPVSDPLGDLVEELGPRRRVGDPEAAVRPHGVEVVVRSARSRITAASAAGSFGGTSVAALGMTGEDLGRPAVVGRDHRDAARERLGHHEAERLRVGRGEHEHVEVRVERPEVVDGPSHGTPRERGCSLPEPPLVRLLPGDRRTGDHEVQRSAPTRETSDHASSRTSKPFHVSIRPAGADQDTRRRGCRERHGTARPLPARYRSVSTASVNTRPSRGSSCAAIARDIDTTTVAKRRVRNRSSFEAAAEPTTISRAIHTCGRRVSHAAAQPYQECSEFETSTSARRRRVTLTQSRATETGHARAYPSQYTAPSLR